MKADLNVDLAKAKETLVNFVVPLVCFVLVLLLVGLVLYPTIKGIPILQEELTQAAHLETQLKEKRAKLNDLLDFRNTVEEDVALLGTVLVSEAMVPELLTQISQIAEKVGFEITKLAYSFSEVSDDANDVAVSAGPPYDTVTVSLSVLGTYDQLISFLSDMENAARFTNVETFRYSPDTEEEESTRLDIDFVLSSPYLFIQSDAVTDDPINFDITSSTFKAVVEKSKSLKLYRISAEDLVEVVEEESSTEDLGEGVIEPEESSDIAVPAE